MVKNARQTAICAIWQQFKTQPDRLILNLEFVLFTDPINTSHQQNYSQVYNKKILSLKQTIYIYTAKTVANVDFFCWCFYQHIS